MEIPLAPILGADLSAAEAPKIFWTADDVALVEAAGGELTWVGADVNPRRASIYL